jgi:hypothetical protein
MQICLMHDGRKQVKICKIFEVSTAVTMKNAVFWDVASYRSCLNRRFGGTYRLHPQSNCTHLLQTEQLFWYISNFLFLSNPLRKMGQ